MFPVSMFHVRSDYGEAVASLQVVFCTEGAVTEFSLAGSH